MQGSALITLLTSKLGGRTLDQTYALQLLNIERNKIQEKRNWACMKSMDNSQSIGSGNNYASPINLPTGFMEYLDPERNGGYGAIQLWDGISYVQLTEVAPEMQLTYQSSFGHFWVDLPNSKVYILGQSPKAYTVYQFFKKDLGDITTNTSWSQFPSRYHPSLPIRAAARWRLGTSTDDLNAENAIDNDNEVKEIINDMIMWDANKQLAASDNIDYGTRARRRNGFSDWPRGIQFP
jgi:hypothetical protein